MLSNATVHNIKYGLCILSVRNYHNYTINSSSCANKYVLLYKLWSVEPDIKHHDYNGIDTDSVIIRTDIAIEK